MKCNTLRLLLKESICLLAIFLTTEKIVAQGCNLDSIPADEKKCAITSNANIVYKSTALALGRRQFLDTYLSQEHYSGFDVAAITERQSLSKWKNWAWKSEINVDFASMNNRADNNNTLELMADYRIMLRRFWQVIPQRLTIAVGGGVGLNLGGAYNMRNQNNPAQLRMGIQLLPSAEIVYNVPIKQRIFTARYNFTFHVAGFQFAPKYGQSYYEISQDYSLSNFSATSIASSPTFRQQLTVDIPIAKSCLRLGFLGNYRQTKLHHLKYHSYENSFIVGYTKYF